MLPIITPSRPLHVYVMAHDSKMLSSLMQFVGIMVDLPWQIATAYPTRGHACSQRPFQQDSSCKSDDALESQQSNALRSSCAGVSLGYSQLTDADIVALPVPELQSDGFLFIWVINAKYKFTLDLFQHWGYE